MDGECRCRGGQLHRPSQNTCLAESLPSHSWLPLRPGLELRRGAGFQADGAKRSLDKPELPVANWDGIPAKYPALPAALAGLPLDLHGRRGGEAPAKPFPAQSKSGQGGREVKD